MASSWASSWGTSWDTSWGGAGGGGGLPWSRGGIVPIRYVLSGTANVVPVETVGAWEAGVVPVMEQVGPAHVVPVRETASETPRVKIVLVTPA